MADNVQISAGSGTTVAADDVGGVLFQRVKLTLGSDGNAVDAVAGAGAVSTAVQRTTLASDDPAVVSLAIVDDWDEGDRAKVNPIVGQAGVAGGAGVAGATTQRVVLASDAALPTGTNSIGAVSVNSNAYSSQTTVTRPANATAYSAGDVVGATAAAVTFANAGPSGGHVLITGVDLRIDVAAVPSGMAAFRLHLYDVTPPSALADNAAWDLPSGDRASYLGYLDLTAPTDLGSTLFTQAAGGSLTLGHVKLAAASTSLFCYLVSIGGFTPAGNSEVYTPRLRTVGA